MEQKRPTIIERERQLVGRRRNACPRTNIIWTQVVTDANTKVWGGGGGGGGRINLK